MSQILLDEHISHPRVLLLLQKWIKVEPLTELRRGQHVLDERVPSLLLTLKQPTFVTIDRDFWKRHLCHPDYCLLYFPLRREEQGMIPDLLRALLRLPEFRTRAARMGKVARVSTAAIHYWQFPNKDLQELAWPPPARRKR
jgi:hypothetical protein